VPRSKSGLNEFDLIRRFFVPLTKNAPGAFALSDDAAILSVEPGRNLVVTTDMMVSGVHFLPDTAPEDIAAKLLRVNLSDLASMGAVPESYTLSIALPKSDSSANEAWLKRFATGLSDEQNIWDISLVGGDTVSTPGALTLNVTAFGSVPVGGELRRSGAVSGDSIFVSGTLGDAALGLNALKGDISGLAREALDYLVSRHRRPSPRGALGRRLAGLATSTIDVSDGLAADLEHICEASGVSATVDVSKIPLSPIARSLLDQDGNHLNAILAGGDDYELLFTASSRNEEALAKLSVELDLPITKIGHIQGPKKDEKVRILDINGQTVNLASGGYRHF